MRFFDDIYEYFQILQLESNIANLTADETIKRRKIESQCARFFSQQKQVADAYAKLSQPLEQQRTTVLTEERKRCEILLEAMHTFLDLQSLQKNKKGETLEKLREIERKIRETEEAGFILVNSPGKRS